jgi:signal transduction histidine kinase/CheY-like chemotaxis protein
MSERGPRSRDRRREVLVEISPAILFATIPLIFLASVTLYQLFINAPDAADARALTLQSFKVLRIAGAIEEGVQDAERGQRGYLLTGRDVYLEPYSGAVSKLSALVAELQEATNQSPDQAPRILRLQADLTTKLNELSSTIDAMRTSGFEAAKAIVDTDVGRLAMLKIHADLMEIVDAANGTLEARLQRSQLADRRANETFIAGSLISAAALILGAFLLSRAYRGAARAERILQATLDSVPEGVVAFDELGKLRAWNEKFVGLVRRPAAQFRVGGALPTSQEGDIPVVAWIDELRATRNRAGRPILAERGLANGEVFEIYHSSTGDGGHITTVLDITERRRAEEMIRQAQKLDSLGQMTGGVAHDFNNLLTIIIGCLGFLRRAVGADKKSIERIDMIGVAAERGARLTSQLLAFARKQPLSPQTLNVDQLMHEILPLVRRAVSEAISVEYVTSGGLWNTTIDAAQFQSSVLNLAINSRDAMPDGGKLTIEAANAALDDVYAARHAEVEPGQYVVFAMTDTGKGMDAATMARVLDPFFTTKPAGAGTGLGLPQVYGFVKQSGGHFKIYSEIGEGTTVKLYLPRAAGAAAASASASAIHRPTPATLTGSERILLVDDDEIVRATVSSMLQDLGYEVVTAGSGEAALALLEKGLAVDLLFTDVIMPGPFGGKRLAEKATQIVPSLKVLFTSGYTENSIVHNGRLDAGVELLSKPYDREKLAAKIRKVLDDSESRTR